MKVFAFAIALAGVTTAASLNAQAVPRPGTVITGTSSRRTDCSYNRTTNSVGDIIFGRTNLNTNCRDVNSRDDGSWYQVGRGRNNNSIYERRVRDTNGNLVVQRARRNPDGSFTILSSRVANRDDREWKIQKEREKAIRKEQKRREKEWKKANRNNENSRFDRGDDNDDDDDNGRVSSGVFRNGRVLGVSNSSEREEHGRGKGRKGRDD